MLDEGKPQESACIRCGTCDGFPCLVQAKADAHVVCVTPALRHPNVTLLTGAFVERVETSTTGRKATEVVVRRDGDVERYRSDIIVVAGGAINSAALLLRSANSAHPEGLANQSGVVRRRYMCHNNSALIAISRTPNPTRFQKTLGLNDFYFGDTDYALPLGHIQMLGKTNAAMFQGEAHHLLSGFAAGKLASHALDFWLTTEDLPDPENRVLIDRDGGIRLHYRPNNTEPHQRLTRKLRHLLDHIGCEPDLFSQNAYFGKRLPIAGTGHQNGTIRFGHDPKSSALDVNCRAHEVDNLYVVDGSFFPSSAAVNPTLTIIANALRVGDHLLGVLVPGVRCNDPRPPLPRRVVARRVARLCRTPRRNPSIASSSPVSRLDRAAGFYADALSSFPAVPASRPARPSARQGDDGARAAEGPRCSRQLA